MALITKYRPQSFDQLLGNSETVKSVKRILASKDRAHGWMFSGAPGCGKTTIARIIARELGASEAGTYDTDTAHYRNFDSMKQLIEQCKFKTPGSEASVYILEECHQLTREAQNVLLKTLEEPPEHVYFILCTTEPEKVKDTIRQRCLHYVMERLKEAQIDELVQMVAESEDIDLIDDVADAIIEAAGGSPRLALNLLQKCAASANKSNACRILIDEYVRENEVLDRAVELVDMLSQNRKAAWAEVARHIERAALKPGSQEQIGDFKRALIGVLNQQLLRAPSAWMVEAVLLLEKDLYGANTRGGLTARVHRIWESCSSDRKSSRAKRETKVQPRMDLM